MECLALWPSYIGEKGRALGKTYEIKERCYWEPIGNTLGTYGICWETDGNPLELEGNFVGNKRKMKKGHFRGGSDKTNRAILMDKSHKLDPWPFLASTRASFSHKDNRVPL
jgi:hypothetical protein